MHTFYEIFQEKTPEQIYETLLQLGAQLKPLATKYHTTETQVFGCQSIVYLRSFMKDEHIYFEGFSDALITKGILQLLITRYSDKTAEKILKADLSELEALQIPEILSPSRANGLRAIFQRMQKEALVQLTYH